MPKLRVFPFDPAPAGTGTSARWRDNPRNLPLAALALSNLLILLLSVYLLLQTRAEHVLRAQILSQNISSAVDRNLTSSAQKIDLALNAIVDEINGELARNRLDRATVEALMTLQGSRLPEASGVRMADARGALVMGFGIDPNRGLSISDRAYFQWHREHDDGLPVVSAGLVSRVTGRRVVIFSRRIERPQHRFGGVVYVAVPVERFESNLSGFDLGPNGRVEIRDAGLGLVAWRLGPGLATRPQLSEAPLAREALSWARSGTPAATLPTAPGENGGEGFVTVRRLEGWPFVTVAAVAERDYLAAWWQEAEVSAAIDLSVLLMSLLAGRTLTRLLARAQQREQRVMASEAQLKQAQKIAGLGSFDLNLRSGELHWSDGHYELWGLEPQSVPVSQALFLQSIHPEDVARVAAEDRRLLGEAGPYAREYRVCLPDGRERHLLDQGLVYFEEDGQAPHLIGTVQDITRQKSDAQASRLASERQEVLRRILEIVLEGGKLESVIHSALGTLFTLAGVSPTRTGAVLACVPGNSGLQVRAALAVDADTVLERARQRSGDCIWSTSGQCATCPAHPASATNGTGALPMDQQISVDPDGCHWVPIVSGPRLIGLLAVWRAACDRDRSVDALLISVATVLATYLLRADAEHALLRYQQELESKVSARTAELQASESRARALLALMMEGVAHLNADGTVSSANEPILAMFGYREADLLGKHFAALVPDAFSTAADGGSDAGSNQGSPQQAEGLRADGSTFPVEVVVSRFDDPAGSSCIGLVRDLTTQKARERELQEALASAQSATQTKGRFLANMSHEIRTPLNAILGLAKIGRRGGSAESTSRVLDRIGEAGEHLLGLVNDILDTSKIEAGKLSLECKPFNLRHKVAGVVRFFSGRAEAKQLSLTVEIAASVPEWVKGDALRLAQVLTNLLSNALKFTPKGSVALTIGQGGNGDRIRFTVRDTGIGMNAEQIARLFKPFEQADSSTTRNYGGTGLGLSISQDLAHLMGGTIEVESTPDIGSCFTLSLPLARTTPPGEPIPAAAPARMTAQQAARAAGGRLAGLSILAAEDVELNRLILEDLLRLEGASVEFAANGKVALDILHQSGSTRFDAVLMDVQMPVMDGIEATRRIVAIAPQLPVIGLTAHTLPEEHSKCREAGMMDVVTKPVDATALVLALQRQVGTRAVPPDAPTAVTAEGAIDWAGLMSRFNGRQTFVTKLVTSVLSHHAETPARLRAAAAAGERGPLGFMVHGLKGMGGNLLASGLRTLATEVDEQLRCEGPLPLDRIEALAQSLEAVLAELANPEILEGTAP